MNKGQSLIEIVFAIGVVALVLTAIVSLSVRSVGVTSTSANQTEANRYAEEVVQWFKRERDTNPQTFFTRASGPMRRLCFNTLPPPGAPWPTSDCATGSVITGTPFTRRATVLLSGNELSIKVEVLWGNNSVVHNSLLTDPRAR